MQFKYVKENPINQKSGDVVLIGVKDSFFNTPGLWVYRRDSSTGHLWLDPRPDDESIHLIYQTYYTHNIDNTSGIDNKSLWCQSIEFAQYRSLNYPKPIQTSFLAKLISYMPTVQDAATLDLIRIPAKKKGRLLDFGCGNGTLMKKMSDRGWVVVGIEPDVKAAKLLAQNQNFRVYDSIANVKLNEFEPFDIVVLSHVIEHVPDPVKTLRALSTLMNDSSKLIVTTPNISGLGSRIFGKFWRGLEPPRHLNLFTPKSLKLTFKNANLKVIDFSTEVRMARGIWYQSYLARIGYKNLEIDRTQQHRLVKFLGYIFQMVEALFVNVLPELGEELYCVGVLSETNASPQKTRYSNE